MHRWKVILTATLLLSSLPSFSQRPDDRTGGQYQDNRDDNRNETITRLLVSTMACARVDGAVNITTLDMSTTATMSATARTTAIISSDKAGSDPARAHSSGVQAVLSSAQFSAVD
jgi:hypothetical protein